jgi:hypothetical protein
MRKSLLPLLVALSTPALAAELELSVEIPQLDVAEYHRPYVAIWLERPDQSHVANLAVWYDGKLADREGEKWLKDIDGVSGATRKVGTHTLSFTDKDAAFKDLPAGEYRVVVEAAREVGGRELLRVPFQWPVEKAANSSAQGSSELGAIQLTLKP